LFCGRGNKKNKLSCKKRRKMGAYVLRGMMEKRQGRKNVETGWSRERKEDFMSMTQVGGGIKKPLCRGAQSQKQFT